MAASSPPSVDAPLRPRASSWRAGELRNADDVDQRQVEKSEPVAAVADLAILNYRRGAQVLDGDRLTQQFRAQRRAVAGLEERNGVVSECFTSVGYRLP
jgi:hypothetical protein